jgi:hypothetical protein
MLLLTTHDESIESEAATWADTLCYAPADIKFKLPRKPPPREIPHAVITVAVVARAAGGATRACLGGSPRATTDVITAPGRPIASTIVAS